MKNFGRRFDYFLKDMHEAMMRILDYTHQSNYEEFETNLLMRDAVIRNFEIMGECVKHVPFSFQKKYKGIPWQHMLNLRNFIVHEYFDVDNEILWEIIQQDLNKNAHELNDIILHSNPEAFIAASKAARRQKSNPNHNP
jgi:uncharacterized protein with HEPN domain